MFKKLVQRFSFFGSEIVFHFHLISIKKMNVNSYFSSPFRILIIILFSILFLPHVFVVVKDINFVIAYEVDPGSIIQSILSLYQHSYNMNAAYHSQYYGWTYYSLNFLLIAPVYIAHTLKVVANDYFLFVSIRFILFLIGLASVLAFYEVAYRTLKHSFLSFMAAILYIASPVVFKFFYFIHPETTGILFILLSVLCLLQYIDAKASDYRWYSFGLLSLVLSILSKHVFVIFAPGVIFLFIYYYCFYQKVSFFQFVFSRKFVEILLKSILFSIFIFFIINPYAFFQPKIFITNQIFLFSSSTQSALTNIEAIVAWIKVIKTIPIVLISIFLFPFTFLGAIFFGRYQRIGMALYSVNILSAIIFVIIMVISSRFLITETYFAPVFPFFVLNLMSIPLFIINKWNRSAVKLIIYLPLLYFLFFVLIRDFSASLPEGYNRFMYQNSETYKVYMYIEENIPSKSKIAYDQFVAIPSDKNIKGCHYWQGCGTDYIEDFQPDYIIFNKNWTFNGFVHLPTQRLIKYITDHNFKLIDTIGTLGVWEKTT
jgi:hypothetical protein